MNLALHSVGVHKLTEIFLSCKTVIELKSQINPLGNLPFTSTSGKL